MRVYTNRKIYAFGPKKEKNSLVLSSRVIWVLLFFILVVGLVYFFLFSSYFRIKNVYIVGADKYEDKVNQVINQELKERANIFLFQNQAVEKKISEKYPIFSQVKIYKGFPDALKIDLKKREPVLICKSQGNEFLIDKEGVAFKGEGESFDLPILERDQEVKLKEKTFSNQFVQFFLEIVNEFSSKTNLKIKQIIASDNDYLLEVYSDRGWKAIFDTMKSAQKQLDNLALILPQIGDQKIEYIDLRLEEKIYYK